MINHFLLKKFADEDTLILFENIKFSEDEKEEFHEIKHYVAEQSSLKFMNKQEELETFIKKFPGSIEHIEKTLALQLIIDYYYHRKIDWKAIKKRREAVKKSLRSINIVDGGFCNKGDRVLYNNLIEKFEILNSIYRQHVRRYHKGRVKYSKFNLKFYFVTFLYDEYYYYYKLKGVDNYNKVSELLNLLGVITENTFPTTKEAKNRLDENHLQKTEYPKIFVRDRVKDSYFNEYSSNL